MRKITPADFEKSLYYIGPGYDIEPLLRFTNLTDTFIYVNLFLSLKEVTGWYEKQFALHPDIEVIERDIFQGFDETKHFELHPNYISHLMRPTFLELQELKEYRKAFEQAFELPQWAITYRLKRKTSGREITLFYLTTEGLASYLALSHNGEYAPRILTTVRTNVLENPRGLMNRFFENDAVKKPALWIRGFMPLPPIYTDFFGTEIRRTDNGVLDPVGMFSRVGLSFNQKWICGRFEDDDFTNERHCKGFVTGTHTEAFSKFGFIKKIQGSDIHQLVTGNILTYSIDFMDQDIIVVPEKIGEQLERKSQVITWKSIIPLEYNYRAKRNGFVPAAEQLHLLQLELQHRNVTTDATIHMVPYCMEDEGEQYFESICKWPVKTVTYVTGLLDFIDQRDS